MKRLSLQWRITLMTAALIGVTCVLMNCLIGYSGKRYMDAIGSGISAYSEIESGAPDAFDPQSKQPDDELTIIISGAQAAFGVTNWYITAAVTLAGGVLAYFVSGRALRPLRSLQRRWKTSSRAISRSKRSARTCCRSFSASAARSTA